MSSKALTWSLQCNEQTKEIFHFVNPCSGDSFDVCHPSLLNPGESCQFGVIYTPGMISFKIYTSSSLLS